MVYSSHTGTPGRSGTSPFAWVEGLAGTGPTHTTQLLPGRPAKLARPDHDHLSALRMLMVMPLCQTYWRANGSTLRLNAPWVPSQESWARLRFRRSTFICTAGLTSLSAEAVSSARGWGGTGSASVRRGAGATSQAGTPS